MKSGLADNGDFYSRLFPSAPDLDRLALKHQTGITYGMLEAEIERWRRRLADQGVRRNSLVAMSLPNSFTFVYVLYALWKQGAQAMLIDPRLKRAEADDIIQSQRPNFFIHPTEAPSPLGGFKEEIAVGVDQLHEEESPRVYALRLFSSGSTGKPKTIGRKAEALLLDMRKLSGGRYLEEKDRVLALSPLCHTYGLLNGLMQTLCRGAALHFASVNLSKSLLKTIREDRITVIYGVPFHYQLLLESPDDQPLPDVRAAISAGEPLSIELYEQFAAKYGVRIGQQYGTSETGVLAMDWKGEHPGSVGCVLEGVELSMAGEEEIAVRLAECPYLDEQGAERYREGAFHTSDRGERRDGLLYVHGRMDSVMAIGGLKVDLLEIEAKLRQFPGIADVTVYADRQAGSVGAYVQAKDGCKEEELLSWCRTNMAAHKIPQALYWVDELPRTSTGKVIRRRLEGAR
ncbi:class I adenylate-forming enzyme family protein [Cohnella boryungensis]|uniref:Class I adenylate-forming enzyme family protein n=1 Tax=Cohnella boryungensis TaxID=768479 RepID=A0ABV8SF57_9BACL